MGKPGRMGVSIPLPDIEKGISTLGKNIERTVQDIGKNIEESGQIHSQALGEMSRGNFNNALQTSVRGSAALLGIKGKEARDVIGETTTERRMREAGDKATAEEAATTAALEAKNITAISNVFEQMVTARRRTPGRRATLLSGGGQGSLLTGGGNY